MIATKILITAFILLFVCFLIWLFTDIDEEYIKEIEQTPYHPVGIFAIGWLITGVVSTITIVCCLIWITWTR